MPPLRHLPPILVVSVLAAGCGDPAADNPAPSRTVIEATDRLTDTLQTRRARRQARQDSLMESILEEGG